MAFDFNAFTQATRSTPAPKTRVQAPVVEKLRATLGTTPQESLRYDASGADAKMVTNAQGRLNAIGRRKNVEFSVQTQRVEFEGRTYIEAWAVAKRPGKGPRGRK